MSGALWVLGARGHIWHALADDGDGLDAWQDMVCGRNRRLTADATVTYEPLGVLCRDCRAGGATVQRSDATARQAEIEAARLERHRLGLRDQPDIGGR